MRRIAVNALGNHAGTVVVMDPMPGRVYSMVNHEWALRRGFKPCSTIKLVTGVAGLSEKLVADLDRMVPGMVGAVNYGTACKSYDPTQTGQCNRVFGFHIVLHTNRKNIVENRN